MNLKPEAAVCPACDGKGCYGIRTGKHLEITKCARCNGTGVIAIHAYIWEDLARRHTRPKDIPDELQGLFARAIDEAHAWLETAWRAEGQEWRDNSTFLKLFGLGAGGQNSNKMRAGLLFLRTMRKFPPAQNSPRRRKGGQKDRRGA